MSVGRDDLASLRVTDVAQPVQGRARIRARVRVRVRVEARVRVRVEARVCWVYGV